MWRALRIELSYSRWWLLGGLGLAVGVAGIVSLIFFAVGAQGPPHHAAAGIRGMFLMMAPLIVGFVILTYRNEERRARLLMAGPITPRQLAGAAVLLPIVLFGIGLVAAALTLGVDSLVTGRLEVESMHIVGYVGGLILMMQLMGLVAQESIAAHRQQRLRAAVTGWGGFVVAVLLLAALTAAGAVAQGPMTWPMLHLGNLVVAVLAGVGALALYSHRTDFTS